MSWERLLQERAWRGCPRATAKARMKRAEVPEELEGSSQRGAGGRGQGAEGAAGETGRQPPPGGWGQGSTWAPCFPLSMVRSPPKVLSLESP